MLTFCVFVVFIFFLSALCTLIFTGQVVTGVPVRKITSWSQKLSYIYLRKMGASCCKCFKGKKRTRGIKDINRNRRCTDLMFCGIFSCCPCSFYRYYHRWVYAGNVESLFFGTDANGMTCGSLNNNMGDNAVNKRDSPFIVYPRIQRRYGQTSKGPNLA